MITDVQNRYHAAGNLFAAALRRMALALKYAEDQPRVPAGSPDGGQWTSGGGIAISTPVELLSELIKWSLTGSFDFPAIFRVAAADIPRLADAVIEWLGPGAIQHNSDKGAIQFLSADRVRKIRFDITPATSHGLKPHINVDPGRLHIYVKSGFGFG
jgi:hypothetical protein